MNNSSASHFDWFKYYTGVCIFLLVQICMLGIVTNAISCIVFLQSYFRHLSINVLLAAVSFADVGFLVLSIPAYVQAPLFEFIAMPDRLYAFSAIYLHPILVMFHTTSVWLLVLISFERWLAVCKPFLVGVYCTRSRAIVAIVCVCTLSIFYNVCRFWEFKLENGIVSKNLRADPAYMLWYVTVGNWVAKYFIPLLLLIYFNTLINMQLRRSSHAFERLLSNATYRTAAMLNRVVLVFILCYTLSFLLNLYELYDPSIFGTRFGFALSDLSNILVVANAAASFPFYFRFSSRFRSTVIYLLRCRKPTFSNFTTAQSLNPSRRRTMSVETPNSVRRRSCSMVAGRPAELPAHLRRRLTTASIDVQQPLLKSVSKRSVQVTLSDRPKLERVRETLL